jgi:hypothetical protein
VAPERVDRLVAMSVGHPASSATLEQREKSWYMLLFQFPEAEAILQQRRLGAAARVGARPTRSSDLEHAR